MRIFFVSKGNEFKIVNYSIDKPDEVYVGLFGYNKGVIQNLGVEGFAIDFDTDKTSGYYVGGSVASNEGIIKESYAIGIINAAPSSKNENYFLGGLVGNNNGSILNSYATVNINENRISTDFFLIAGGLIGLTIKSTIENSYATGDVSAISQLKSSANAGGIVGYNQTWTIINCFIYTEQVITRMEESDTYKTASNTYGHFYSIKNDTVKRIFN